MQWPVRAAASGAAGAAGAALQALGDEGVSCGAHVELVLPHAFELLGSCCMHYLLCKSTCWTCCTGWLMFATSWVLHLCSHGWVFICLLIAHVLK